MKSALSVKRMCKDFFIRPSKLFTVPNSAALYIQPFRPFGRTKSNTIQSQPSSISFISVLLFAGSPLHVTRLVSFVVVYALNSMRRSRARADIAVKLHEVINPRPEDCNTTSAVLVVGCVGGRQATALHFRPYPIFRRALHAVYSQQCRRVLTTIAATRFSKSSLDVSREHDGQLTTITKAFPHAVAFFLSENSLQSELPESGSNWYDSFGWHVRGLQRLTNVLARLIGLQPFGPFLILPQGVSCG